jgi:hypothetical protein
MWPPNACAFTNIRSLHIGQAYRFFEARFGLTAFFEISLEWRLSLPKVFFGRIRWFLSFNVLLYLATGVAAIDTPAVIAAVVEISVLAEVDLERVSFLSFEQKVKVFEWSSLN